MSDDSLAGMVVKFTADLADITSAPDAIGEAFNRVASDASETAAAITESLTGAAESFSSLSEAASVAGVDIGDGLMVSYESLDELASVSTETAATVEESLSSVNFDAFQGALQSLTSAVDAATTQINEQLATIPAKAEESATKSKSAFDGFSLGGTINQVGMTIFSLQNMANMATQLAGGLLQPAMNAEKMQESFTNLTGSSQAASDELEKLDSFAAKTQFTTMDIDAAGAQLLGFGFKASSIIPIVQAVGDNLSAVGKGTPAEVQSVIDIFGKMSTQGKLTAMDINQLGTHGIKALQDIASGAGLSTTEISKMIKNGTLPANQAISDLTAGIEKNPIYAGGMAKQSGTLSGIMSTLSSDWDVFMSKLMSPALPMLEQGLGNLTNLLTNPSFQAFATLVGTTLVNGIKTVATDITNLVTTGQNLVNFFKNNQTAMNLLVAGLIAFGGVLAGVILPGLIAWGIEQMIVAAGVIATAAPFILVGVIAAGVIFGIIELFQHWSQVTAAVGGFFQNIWGHVTQFFQDDVQKPFMNAINAIGGAFSGLGTLVHNIGNGIGDAIKGGIDAVISGINGFIGFIDSIQIHIPSIGIGPVATPAFNWNGLGLPKIPLLSTGGVVPPGSVAVAGDPGPYSELVFGGTSGATVLSHAQSAGFMANSGAAAQQQPIEVHVYLDGRELTQQLGMNLLSMVRSHGPVGATI